MEHDSDEVSKWFCRKSHHHDCDVIYIQQNLFHRGKTNRDINLNANYICLFRARRDFSQLERLNYQLLGSNHKQFLTQVYKYVTQDKPYSFLFIDLEQTTPDSYRFRDSIIVESGVTAAYIPI